MIPNFRIFLCRGTLILKQQDKTKFRIKIRLQNSWDGRYFYFGKTAPQWVKMSTINVNIHLYTWVHVHIHNTPLFIMHMLGCVCESVHV